MIALLKRVNATKNVSTTEAQQMCSIGTRGMANAYV